ncbi:hypothetical protein ACFTAO_07385 [Paenibacillus rhizoplanae]
MLALPGVLLMLINNYLPMFGIFPGLQGPELYGRNLGQQMDRTG